MLFLLYQSAKVRISERKTKGNAVFLFVFPSESTFEVYLKGTNKRAKNKWKRSISFCVKSYKHRKTRNALMCQALKAQPFRLFRAFRCYNKIPFHVILHDLLKCGEIPRQSSSC